MELVQLTALDKMQIDSQIRLLKSIINEISTENYTTEHDIKGAISSRIDALELTKKEGW